MSELLSDQQKLVDLNIARLKVFLSEAIVPGSVGHEVLVDFVTIRRSEMKIYQLRKISQRKFRDNGKAIPILMKLNLLDKQRSKRELDEIIIKKTKESKSYKRAFTLINETHLFYINSDNNLTSRLGSLLELAARIADPHIPPLI